MESLGPLRKATRGARVMAKLDVAEVSANMIFGALINCTLTYFIFGVTAKFALATTGLFFAVSWIRSYGFRKLFRHLEKRLKIQG